MGATGVAAGRSCVKCGLTANELYYDWTERAVNMCKDWYGCVLRSHAGDVDWSRCRNCGDEFVTEESAMEQWCDHCTNFGVS